MTILLSLLWPVLVWWVAGVVLFTYSAVYVERDTPLHVKVQAALVSGFLFPYYMVKTGGKLPAVVIMSANPTDEEQARYEEWSAQLCKCSKCRARRGE